MGDQLKAVELPKHTLSKLSKQTLKVVETHFVLKFSCDLRLFRLYDSWKLTNIKINHKKD